MKGIYIAEQGHVASVIAPVDFTGGKTGRWLSLTKYGHITFLLAIGVSAAAPTAILVKGAQDSSGTGAAAIAFDLFTAETSTVDLLSAKTRQSASGYTTISANDDIFYVIEVDASDVAAQLGESFNHITVNVTNGSNSAIASCVAILSGPRYEGDQSAAVNV